MRIVQVVETLELGGLERMAVDLAIEQKKAGHETHIHCIFKSGVLAQRAVTAGIPVHNLAKRYGFSPTKLLELVYALKRTRPHVVHAHNPGIHHYATFAARLAGVPVVINTRHGTGSNAGQRYRERPFRLAYGLTDQVVFVSDETRRFYTELGLYRRKSRVIPNGIPVESFARKTRPPGSERPRIRFGTVGRIVPVKAHALMIDAFAQLLKQLPEARLRIVGGGVCVPELAARIRELGVQPQVSLEDPRSDIANVLQELDVFVVSSISEGLPLAVLEAMAAGLPLVSTRVGGIPEAAPEGEVAWYAPPGDVDALAKAMLQAAQSPCLSRMGARAAEIARSRYDISVMHRAYEQLYEELLQGRN